MIDNMYTWLREHIGNSLLVFGPSGSLKTSFCARVLADAKKAFDKDIEALYYHAEGEVTNSDPIQEYLDQVELKENVMNLSKAYNYLINVPKKKYAALALDSIGLITIPEKTGGKKDQFDKWEKRQILTRHLTEVAEAGTLFLGVEQPKEMSQGIESKGGSIKYLFNEKWTSRAMSILRAGSHGSGPMRRQEQRCSFTHRSAGPRGRSF